MLFNNHQKFSWTNSKWLTIECLWYFRKSVYDLGGGQLIFSIRWVSKTLCWQIFSVVFEVLVKLAVRLILTLTKMTKYPWQFLKSSLYTWVVILTNGENWFHERNFQTQAHKKTKLVMTPTSTFKERKSNSISCSKCLDFTIFFVFSVSQKEVVVI